MKGKSRRGEGKREVERGEEEKAGRAGEQGDLYNCIYITDIMKMSCRNPNIAAPLRKNLSRTSKNHHSIHIGQLPDLFHREPSGGGGWW